MMELKHGDCNDILNGACEVMKNAPIQDFSKALHYMLTTVTESILRCAEDSTQEHHILPDFLQHFEGHSVNCANRSFTVPQHVE